MLRFAWLALSCQLMLAVTHESRRVLQDGVSVLKSFGFDLHEARARATQAECIKRAAKGM
tara:strand:+ start:2667 stop:2846 length:180 start_codon:yes stop_codon:yes gene_type:complete